MQNSQDKDRFDDFSKRALFIHIPKTGGASMSTAPFILKQASPMMSPTTEFIMNLPFRFSFVRNPYDRIASVILNLDWATEAEFTGFVTNELPKLHEQGLKEAKEQQLWSMSRYLYFDGILEVDFLGRFENLKEDWKKVCEKIDYDFELPHENKSKHEGYNKFYTPETIRIINRLYSEDFDNFGYMRRGGEKI